jgi:hypothetical protein
MADENPLNALFEVCPHIALSNFERVNFDDSSGSNYSRYIIGIVNRIRKIDSDLDSETRDYERKCLLEEKDLLEKYLSTQDQEELLNSVKDWELKERDYWAEHLGKIAAIEMLTYGKPRFETMMRMAKLPEDLYAKSVQICVKLANNIKIATANAEEAIGIFTDVTQEAMSEQITPKYTEPPSPPEPKKLLLKKIKE